MSLQTRSMERTSNNDKGPTSLQLRIFIEDLDSLLGSTLVEEFRNDFENDFNPHIIVGNGTHLPRGATSLIDTSNPSHLAQVILDSDVVIFHTSITQATFALKILKHAKFIAPKIFILISSATTWNMTLLKEKNETDTRGSQSVLEQEGEFPFLKKYQRFTESDLNLRKIHCFENRKTLEQLIITNDKPNLHSYVITSGILYGKGEDALYELFKTAWMTPEQELPIQGEGNNVIPLIHVGDLAQIVNKTVQLTPADRYIFAVDYETITQKKLVTTIAKSIGKGAIKTVPITGGVLSMNVWMKPTSIFENDDQYIDAKKNPILNWQCKEGFTKNILKIRDEFKLFRGLDTIKLVVIGPSAVGKSHYCKELAQFYRIPHIQVKSLTHEVSLMQTELGELVRNTLQQVKDQMTVEAQAIFDAEKKKKKVPKGQPEPVFDGSYIVPKLPDSVLIQVYRWRLDQNDAQNLGYILDGFPKTIEQCQALFFEEEKPNQMYIPKGIIHLEGTDEFLKERAKLIEEPTRYSDENLLKRIAFFRKNNESLTEILKQFEILKIDQQNEGTFQEITKFITRKGPIMVLQDEKIQDTFFTEEQIEEPPQILIPEKPTVQVVAPPAKKKGGELNKSINDSRLSKAGEKKLTEEQKQEMIRQQERELLDTRSQPLRQYLADNVVPFLTEGLIEICEKNPENPLEYLANFLEQKGNELQQIGH